jgi:SAM-dependent methyltransferase
VDATLYARIFAIEDRYWWSVGTRAIFREWLHRGLGTRDARLLDVGCGSGALASELRAMGSVTGVDLSHEAVTLSRRRGLEQLCVGDAQALPVRSASLDAVVATDVVEHADDARVIGEIGRVLRSGGVALVHVPAFPMLWGEHDEAAHHRRRYRRAALRRLLEAQGLRVERLSYVVCLLFPLVLAVRVGKRSLGWLRPRPAPEAEIYELPGWLNALLRTLLDIERVVLRWIDLPVGVSLICIARKP